MILQPGPLKRHHFLLLSRSGLLHVSASERAEEHFTGVANDAVAGKFLMNILLVPLVSRIRRPLLFSSRPISCIWIFRRRSSSLHPAYAIFSAFFLYLRTNLLFMFLVGCST